MRRLFAILALPVLCAAAADPAGGEGGGGGSGASQPPKAKKDKAEKDGVEPQAGRSLLWIRKAKGEALIERAELAQWRKNGWELVDDEEAKELDEKAEKGKAKAEADAADARAKAALSALPRR